MIKPWRIAAGQAIAGFCIDAIYVRLLLTGGGRSQRISIEFHFVVEEKGNSLQLEGELLGRESIRYKLGRSMRSKR